MKSHPPRYVGPDNKFPILLSNFVPFIGMGLVVCPAGSWKILPTHRRVVSLFEYLVVSRMYVFRTRVHMPAVHLFSVPHVQHIERQREEGPDQPG